VLIGSTVNELQRLVGWSTVLFITRGLLASLQMGVSQFMPQWPSQTQSGICILWNFITIYIKRDLSQQDCLEIFSINKLILNIWRDFPLERQLHAALFFIFLCQIN